MSLKRASRRCVSRLAAITRPHARGRHYPPLGTSLAWAVVAITASTAGATYATFFAIARRETERSVSWSAVLGSLVIPVLYAKSRQRARGKRLSTVENAILWVLKAGGVRSRRKERVTPGAPIVCTSAASEPLDLNQSRRLHRILLQSRAKLPRARVVTVTRVAAVS
jgi:hypothetical protein